MTTVLIADDVKEMRDLLVQVVEAAGYKALQAKTGMEVLDLLNDEDNKIDLVLLDIDMPKLNGLRAMQEIKKIDPDLKVCFVSGLKDKSIVARAISAGGKDYVVKPIDVTLLTDKIHKLLGKSSQSSFITVEAHLRTYFPKTPIALDFWVKELSEVGLKILTTIPFIQKKELEIFIPRLNSLIEENLNLNCMIDEVSFDKKINAYLLSCSFIGIHENTRAKIRSITMLGKKVEEAE